MRYRQRPVEVDAVQFREGSLSPRAVCWCPEIPHRDGRQVAHVHAPIGPCLVRDGDWVIVDSVHRVYVTTDRDFHAAFERLP